jgi:hypothetical protein
MLWDGKGAWLVGVENHVGDLAWHTRYAQKLADHGFAWVAVPIHDGVNKNPIVGPQLAATLKPYVDRGVKPVGWGGCSADADGSGDLAGRIIRNRTVLKGYIADAEAPYQDNVPGGDSSRSQVFVDAFGASARTRARAPRMLSSFGAGWQETYCRLNTATGRPVFDYRPWQQAGWHFAPQAYSGKPSSSFMTPDECIRQAAACGWAEARIHPSCGRYPPSPIDPEGCARQPLVDWLELLPAGWAQGWNVFVVCDWPWAGSQTVFDDADWQAAGGNAPPATVLDIPPSEG